MPPAKIHNIGPHTGTCVVLAAYVGIAPANFGRRLAKYYSGRYTEEQCMKKGSLSRVRKSHEGTDEWRSLSNKEKDSKLKMSDVPHNWLCR